MTSFYVIPLDPDHARCMPEGSSRSVAHPGRRLELEPPRAVGCPSATRTSASCARAMTIDGYDTPGLYFGTSTGQVFASADEEESWSEIAGYLPPVWSVEVAVID